MPKLPRPVNQLFSTAMHFLDERRNSARMRAMSDTKTQPQFSDKGLSEAALRRQRQAEALRANLARRKAQLRGRAEEEQADTPPESRGEDTPKAQD